MNKTKFKILVATLFLTVIVFAISTSAQRKLIDYEAKVSCLFIAEDIIANQKLSEDMFVIKEVPISLVASIPVITDVTELSNLYAKDNIFKGQIAMKTQFDTKENLSIYEAENGKEKISIKIANSENGLSYAIKANSKVNIYATFRSDYAKNFAVMKDRLTVGDEYDGYTVIKLLDAVQVLGAFNIDGIEVNGYEDGNIDSIMISVTSEEAKEINLLREIATFNVTGVANNEVEESGDISVVQE